MRDDERINRIAGVITQIWEQQHDKSFLQLIETLKSDYIMRQTGYVEKEVFIRDDEFEMFLKEHLNNVIGER
ncbi:hypothetical protein SFC27_10745 [Bacillus licheniformis]|jgi:hypothetical protein|uniref:Uncharacterized protein n=1 Tax=Bacillus licheniformis TaxID=1402 RepID=A0AB37GMB8_BACLI|nr:MULTISPECIES: hypothetical protein [Bacillus]ARC58769.1 hypothetical protein BaDB11_00100 [Bacillus licheniformis]AVI45387.1 hypothetical protein BL14DL4_00119 [Bacillus licheniformis]EQM25341.1 hypothetical protein N399_24120 [Bacillus licheniformis CG-B52]KMM60007.1 hypothetical protein ACH95_09940 [Bacillus glycinifermentans]KND06176.1 hypothetical protein ACJ43_17550 [Bacillus paralicheniformis]